MADAEYSFVSDGIGQIIRQGLLKVPANQRPYAWKENQVRERLDDIKEAMTDESEQYFLGTVVLVEGDSDRKLIADGQQRLATTSIILARCRDLLRKLDEDDDAESIENDFLKRYIRRSKESEFLLSMNIEDDVYFREVIIEPNWCEQRPSLESTGFPSNERLYASSQMALLYLQRDIEHLPHNLAVDQLNRWATFMEERASVVAVTVPDEVGAFRMFETLNDRGLRASQADILKNYFFSKVKQSELEHIQGLWNQIYGALADRFDDPDEQMIKYIKYFWTLENGLTRDRELASNIKKKVRNGKQALSFVSGARTAVFDYVAVFNPADEKWRSYGGEVQEDLRILTQVIDIEQIVPLVFAVSHKFSVPEARKAFRLFVTWSVRFMLGGSGRAGRLDKQYADLAQEVGLLKKTTARELRDFLADKVPPDAAFAKAVREAKVSNAVLARYYLLCLELALSEGSGELVPSTDVNKVNLEHVLPKTWTKDLGITRPEHDDLINRLGNQTIMQSEWNRDLGNMDFGKKKAVYKKSEIALTNSLARLKTFGRTQVDARQAKMAEMAPDIWSVKFG